MLNNENSLTNETVKDNVERFLKETKKTKRDLAKALEISENSINRTVNNPNIKLSKLKQIADFFEVDLMELLPGKGNVIKEAEGEFQKTSSEDAANRLAINNLSEAIKRSSKTIDNLVQIIADNFPNQKDSIENLL